jgi:hypothetical protein
VKIQFGVCRSWRPNAEYFSMLSAGTTGSAVLQKTGEIQPQIGAMPANRFGYLCHVPSPISSHRQASQIHSRLVGLALAGGLIEGHNGDASPRREEKE